MERREFKLACIMFVVLWCACVAGTVIDQVAIQRMERLAYDQGFSDALSDVKANIANYWVRSIYREQFFTGYEDGYIEGFSLGLNRNKSIQQGMVDEDLVSYAMACNPYLTPIDASRIVLAIEEAAQQWDINAELIAAIIERESSFNPYAKNGSSSATGLMQVLWYTHKNDIMTAFGDIDDRRDLFDIRNNIMVGAWKLHYYLKNSDSLRGALIRYRGVNDARYINDVLDTYRSLTEQEV